jgi:hypothetical protein
VCPNVSGRKPGIRKQTPSGPSGNGYLTVSVNSENIPAQWIVADAWLGERPEGLDVCHKDAVRDNNRVDNLYYDTRSRNLKDIWDIMAQKRKSSSSRFKGVCFSKREQRFKAYSDVGKKRTWLGTFSIEEEAALAYNAHVTENKLGRRLNVV